MMDVKSAPFYPPAYELADIMAIKGLVAGTANPEQQQRAIKWIIENACATYELSYRPTSDRDTSFAEGRRFVGLQIVKALKLDISKLQRKEE
jgi:hypothetical protein